MFKEKIALVTGANSGIGKACALRLAKEGATVILTARREELLQSVVKEIEQLGGKAFYYCCDLRSSQQIQELFSNITNQFGQLHIAVNNAGIEGSSFTNIVDYEESVWDEVIAVNLKSVWLCLKHEIKIMLTQQQGSIVNVSSLAGLKASVTGGVAYTASKFGVVGMTRSAALEVAKNGIRINAVCPALVRTPIAEQVLTTEQFDAISDSIPIKRVCEPEEVANIVSWLCSSQSSYITGSAIPVDGGVIA